MEQNKILLIPLIILLNLSVNQCQTWHHVFFNSPYEWNHKDNQIIEVNNGYIAFNHAYNNAFKINNNGHLILEIQLSLRISKFQTQPAANTIISSAADGGFYYSGDIENSIFHTTVNNVNFVDTDIKYAKVDRDGNTQWIYTYRDTNNLPTFTLDIAEAIDGNIFLAGYSADLRFPNSWSYFILKIDTLGQIIWRKYLNQRPLSIDANSDGGVIVMISPELPNIQPGSLIKLNAYGDSLWSKPLGFKPDRLYRARDGGYFISNNTTILRTDSLGNEIWTNAIHSIAIAQLDSNYFYIVSAEKDTSLIFPYNNHNKILLSKFHSAGNLIWKKFLYENPFDRTEPADMITTSDNHLLILGNSFIQNINGATIIKTDSAGYNPLPVKRDTISPGFQTININNINSYFDAYGTFFWDYENTRFFVPGNDSVSPIFAGALWIGGIDPGGTLHLAAQTYRQSGSDYWPGQLDNNGAIDHPQKIAWDKLWKVSKTQVDQHLSDYQDNGIINFPQPSIYEWPGKGNSHARGKYGIALTALYDAAPFIDINANGIYEPHLGEYPDIKGDEMLWYVFNDAYGIHTESLGNILGMEFQISVYGYNCPDDDILYNTLFINYKIINKSGVSYDSVLIGKFIDFDLGCFNNDFVGCDTLSNSFYAYNGTPTDPDCSTRGYGNDPPIQSVTFLNQDMSSFTYSNNDFTIMGSPSAANEYYNYMRGFWRNNTPMTSDRCNGFGGNIPTRYMFPGNPSDFQFPSSWSECSCNNPPADRRGVGAHGPFTFQPGQVFEMTLAYTTHFLPFNGCPDFTPYRQRIDSIQYLFDNHLLRGCDTVILTCDDSLSLGCVWPGDANSDGIANILDVLPIGIAYNTTGAVRPNATTDWSGQPMQDWSQNFSIIGNNYKHTDCNGDGVIDSFDFQPILDNYGLIHFKSPEQGMSGIPFYAEVRSGSFTAGSIVSVDVYLGTQAAQVADFYAVAFTVSYNASVLQPGSATIDLSGSWAGTRGVDLMAIHKEFSSTGQLDIGITRIDQNNRAGYGLLASINYILIDDIAGKDMFQLETLSPWISFAKAIRNDETDIELFLSALQPASGNPVLIYPNPAEDLLYITLPSAMDFNSLKVFNSIGKEVLFMDINEKQNLSIGTGGLPKGIYFIELTGDKGRLVRKVSVVR